MEPCGTPQDREAVSGTKLITRNKRYEKNKKEPTQTDVKPTRGSFQ